MNDDAFMEDVLWPWLADDSMADPVSHAWDGEEPQAEPDDPCAEAHKQ